MSDATDLWTLVEDRYDPNSLVSLTNPRDPEAVAVDAARSVAAAQDVIDAFPLYAQIEYDSANAQHKQVAIVGVISILWERGGTSPTVARTRWEDWVKLLERLKGVEPRSHVEPASSDADPATRNSPYRGQSWSSRKNLRGLLPRPSGPFSPYGGPEDWL